jgi:hypothetical protein
MSFGFIKTMELEKELLERDLKQLEEDNELLMIGGQELLNLRNKYNASSDLLKQLTLQGITSKNIEEFIIKTDIVEKLSVNERLNLAVVINSGYYRFE